MRRWRDYIGVMSDESDESWTKLRRRSTTSSCANTSATYVRKNLKVARPSCSSHIQDIVPVLIHIRQKDTAKNKKMTFLGSKNGRKLIHNGLVDGSAKMPMAL
jgi:hypothetical protein